MPGIEDDSVYPLRSIACARCSTAFSCCNNGPPGSCWCSAEDFRLPQPLPAEFASYQDCLCPVCLREVASELTALGFGPEAQRK